MPRMQKTDKTKLVRTVKAKCFLNKHSIILYCLSPGSLYMYIDSENAELECGSLDFH
jgi:hypothetical protein